MRSALCLFAAFLLAGCAGYQLGPIKPKPMADVTTIAVPSFKSNVLAPRVETLLANAVIRQIQRDGTYRVVDSNSADAVLHCTLESMDRRPNRTTNGNELLTQEYQLTLRVNYRIEKRRTGEQLDRRNVTGSTYFFATGSDTLSSDLNQDEQQAIPLAAEKMAENLVAAISEGW